MPPKKTTTTTKTAAATKKPAAAKGAATKGAAAKKPAAKPPAEKKEEAAPPPPKVEAKRRTISGKQIAKVLIEDDDMDLRSTGLAALVIDNDNHIAARFIPYSGGNVLEASDPSHMDAERIRLAIRGAVRFGKPMCLDFGECGPDMMDSVERKFDEIQKGLLQKCLNREVCKREVYESLAKDGDEDTYNVPSYEDFEGDISKKFIFMIIMKNMVYPASFTEKFYTYTVDA